VIILRIQHPSWNSPQVHKVTTFPCSIGRSIQNTIVLSDNSISAEHAMIEKQMDGTFLLRDLDSTNGIFFEGKRFGQIILRDQGQVKCGDIEITTMLSDDRLEKTRQIELPAQFKTKAQKLSQRILLMSLTLVLLIYTINFLMDPMDSEKWIDVLVSIVAAGVTVFGVAGLASIITKVQHKKYDFLKYLDATLMAAVAWAVFSLFRDRIDFWMNNNVLQMVFSVSVYFAFYWFYSNKMLEIFFEGKYRKRIHTVLGSLFVAFVIFTWTVATFSERNTRFNYQASYVYTTSSFPQAKYNFTGLESKMKESFTDIDEYRSQKNEEKEESRQLEDSLSKEKPE
jgi:hypothetical protein